MSPVSIKIILTHLRSKSILFTEILGLGIMTISCTIIAGGKTATPTVVQSTPIPETSTPVPPKPTPTANGILWQADQETGDLTQWEQDQGGGVYNTGTGTVSITDKVVHSGRYALELTIQNANGENQAVRVFRWGENPIQAYYSAWFYFPQIYQTAEFWNIFQFKSKDGERNDPIWVVNVGNRRSGEMYLYLFDWIERRSYDQTRVNLPVGRWVHIEAFYRRAPTKTGQITVWQDNTLLFDIDNVQTAIGDNVLWSVNNYTNRIKSGTATIYIDDAMISAGRTGP